MPCVIIRFPDDVENSVHIQQEYFELFVGGVIGAGHVRTGSGESGAGQCKRPLPSAVIILPNDVKGTVCADDENLELLVERLVHSGQWRTWRRKARIGQADRRMPGAVMILPDDVQDAVLVNHEDFELLVGGIVDRGDRRAGYGEVSARQREWSFPTAVIVLPDDVERTVRIDDENFHLFVERLVHGGNRRGRWQSRAVSRVGKIGIERARQPGDFQGEGESAETKEEISNSVLHRDYLPGVQAGVFYATLAIGLNDFDMVKRCRKPLPSRLVASRG